MSAKEGKRSDLPKIYREYKEKTIDKFMPMVYNKTPYVVICPFEAIILGDHILPHDRADVK